MRNSELSRMDRVFELKEKKGIDALLLTSPSSVTWLSGYFYYFEIGLSPFQFLPASLVMTSPHNQYLILADNESFDSGEKDGIKTLTYPSYTYEQPLDFTNQYLNVLCNLIREQNLTKSKIGVEAGSLPVAISEMFIREFPEIGWVDLSKDIVNLKAVKDPDEITRIREAASFSDIGQKSVLVNARTGMTELELFSKIRTEMEAIAGTRLPIMLDLVSGKRTAEGGGIPSNNKIKDGDLVLSDLTPCFNGYWGDTCNTIVVGKPTDQQKEYFAKINETLHMAIDFIKPGIMAKEVDEIMRKNLSKTGHFDHHGGHGVGTNNHEEPRIVPYNDMVLESNMVIALEPAIYSENFGLRLEHLVLVTPDGCEILSKFNHCFEQI